MRRLIIITIVFSVVVFTLLPANIFARTTQIESVGAFGPVDMQVGVEVLGQLDASQANDIDHYFSGTHIYIKVVDPSASLFSSPAFAMLAGKGFRWYFTFSTGETASSALSAFATSGKTQGAVVELKEGVLSSLSSLKSQYPQFLFHAAEYGFWPRENVRKLVHEQPEIEAVSIYIEGPDGDVFDYARLMFDTFYDASNDVEAGSSIVIDYPPGKKLSLSSLRLKQSSSSGEAFAAAVVGDILVSSVQDSKAPFRYINLGRFSQYSSGLKETFSNLAKVIEGRPSLVWPRAMTGNGNPYDNEFPGFENSNSKPVMGVILRGNSGLFSMIVNASGTAQNITLNGTPVSLAAYEVHREGGSSIAPAPVVPTSVPIIPTAWPTNIIPPTSPTDIPALLPTTKPFVISPPQEGIYLPPDPSIEQPNQKSLTLPPAENVVHAIQNVLEIPKQGIGRLYIWDRLLEIYIKIWMMKFTSIFQ